MRSRAERARKTEDKTKKRKREKNKKKEGMTRKGELHEAIGLMGMNANVTQFSFLYYKKKTPTNAVLFFSLGILVSIHMFFLFSRHLILA